MGVNSTNGLMKMVAPRPAGLPTSLNLQQIVSSATGNVSGGSISLRVSVRPEGGTNDLYVAIISCTTATASATAQTVRMYLEQDGFDDPITFPVAASVATKLTVTSGTLSLARLVDNTNPVYAGRVADSKTGDISVNWPTNVDGHLATMFGWVLTSNRPFIIPKFAGM